MNTKKSEFQEELLEAWEASYKKGQLTLWLFLALKEKEKYVGEIRAFIEEQSQGTIICEEQSLYRTLRKFRNLEMVDFNEQEGNKGPMRKYYYLTALGEAILEQFIERNIKLFFNENLQELLFSKSIS